MVYDSIAHEVSALRQYYFNSMVRNYAGIPQKTGYLDRAHLLPNGNQDRKPIESYSSSLLSRISSISGYNSTVQTSSTQSTLYNPKSIDAVVGYKM